MYIIIIIMIIYYYYLYLQSTFDLCYYIIHFRASWWNYCDLHSDCVSFEVPNSPTNLEILFVQGKCREIALYKVYCFCPHYFQFIVHCQPVIRCCLLRLLTALDNKPFANKTLSEGSLFCEKLWIIQNCISLIISKRLVTAYED